MKNINLINSYNAMQDKQVVFKSNTIHEEYNAFKRDENKRKLILLSLASFYLVMLLASLTFLTITIF